VLCIPDEPDIIYLAVLLLGYGNVHIAPGYMLELKIS